MVDSVFKTLSYKYRKSHCGEETVLRPSYLHITISYTSKTTHLYWIRARLFYGTSCALSILLGKLSRERPGLKGVLTHYPLGDIPLF